jgi:hypothetical protein
MNTPRESRSRAFAAKLRGFLRGQQSDDQVDDEIREHLRLLTERFVAQGMSREDAALAARRQFGNTTLLHEDRRALQTLPSIEVLWRDLRYALRTFVEKPGIFRGRGPRPGARDRVEHGHLQRRPCHVSGTAPLSRFGPARHGLVEQSGRPKRHNRR